MPYDLMSIPQSTKVYFLLSEGYLAPQLIIAEANVATIKKKQPKFLNTFDYSKSLWTQALH